MKLFATLMKVDVEKRQVWGRATQEVPDKSGEIFDYDSSVPHFKDWSASFEKATEILGDEGKSLGNIRAMHGKVAAGKVISIDFNDSEKAIDIGTEITDDAEWAKVLKGTYTGFSIGGNYVKQWKDDANTALTRFTAKPAEISIVDNPCVPTATFSMVKADGAVEEVPFAPVAQADGTPAADAPPAAVEGQPAVAETEKVAPVKKGMYTVRALADVLQSVAYMASDAQWETDYEKDGSTIPADLRTWLSLGIEIFKKMSAEETAELVASLTPPEPVLLELAAGGDLQKKGARNSKSDLEKLQGIHDHSVAMGASCSDSEKAAGGDLEKVTTLEKQLGDLTTERDSLKKRVDELEALPEAPKGIVKTVAVDKAQDVDAKLTPEEELLDPNDPQFSLKVMKAVQRRGVVISR